MSAYLDTQPELPTAFFADNDIIAFSCMRALKEHGYRIPEDVSIVGFDDMPFCTIMSPALTTMSVSKEALGRAAIYLLDRRMNEKPAYHVKFELSTELRRFSKNAASLFMITNLIWCL